MKSQSHDPSFFPSQACARLWALFFAVAFLAVGSLHVIAENTRILQYQSVDASDTLIPSLWLSGNLLLHPQSTDYHFFPHVASFAPHVQAWISRISRLDMLAIERYRALAGVIIGFFAMFLTGYALKRSFATAAIAAAIIPLSWPHTTLGYQFFLWKNMIFMGFWSMGACALIWSLWLVIGHRPRWRYLPAALAGLLFNLHPTYAVILAVVFLVFEFRDGLTLLRGARPFFLRHILTSASFFAILGAPQIVRLTASPIPGLDPSLENSWWWIM